jgi:hypothetical protein
LKKLALLGAGVGLAVGALLVSHTSHAADHLDSPGVMTNRMADLNDVYAWMTSDDKKVNLIMTVSPAEGVLAGDHHFDNTVQYVWHVTSHPGATNKLAFGAAGTESRVICTFASDTSAQCWVTAGTSVKDYVKGDPSATTGVQSASHKLKVFAGKRSDPFFFNLAGLKKTIGAVEANAGILTFDAAGCPSDLPAVGAVSAQTLRTLLSTESTTAVAPCAANQIDCFQNFNVMSVVVQVDADLVLDGTDHVFSVWASTHMAP